MDLRFIRLLVVSCREDQAVLSAADQVQAVLFVLISVWMVPPDSLVTVAARWTCHSCAAPSKHRTMNEWRAHEALVVAE